MQRLIIGVGNEFRGDDIAGLNVVRGLAHLESKQLLLTEAPGDASDLIELWKDHDDVILIDAVSSGGIPGSVYRFDVIHESLPSEWSSYSTHALGIYQGIELARVLNRLPKKLILYGIEGELFKTTTEVSKEVKTGIKDVIQLIENEINHV